MTEQDRFDQAQILFSEARRLPLADRDAFLIGACDDEELRREVAALLAYDPGDAISACDLEAGPGAVNPDAPQNIGPYRILGVLGEGGMGRVYLAQQAHPVTRHVALKVIKLGMDSRAVLMRFELERQALALMNHDAIARVFDCGTTERGQPFFVMELVEGAPITDYCDERQLTIHERLVLFDQVCQGVQHAHQKGVVHRDLKPGNVLVVRHGDRHAVKIIDFGIARATDRGLAEGGTLTEHGAMIGTPEYMSPEQVDPTASDIDTRTDVYSLGVLLYELLCGRRPHEFVADTRADMAAVRDVLLRIDPPRPSSRCQPNSESAARCARARGLSVGGLRKTLRGDLDWITLRALEKDRGRRYDTPSGLAMDLRRWLAHEPVTAGPPTASYRLKKLLRRYRAHATAIVTILITAVVGAALTLRYAIEASDYLSWFGAPFRYESAALIEQQLYPAWPYRIPDLEGWLARDHADMLALRADVESAIATIRTQALPWTDHDRQSDRRAHPRYAEWAALGEWVTSLRRMLELGTSGERPAVPTLDEALLGLDALMLNSYAYQRVAPPAVPGENVFRVVHGEEAIGLTAAREAARRTSGSPDAHRVLDTLAWALLFNGHRAEARKVSAEALRLAPADEQGRYRGFNERLEHLLEHGAEVLAGVERERLAVSREVEQRRTWRFASGRQQFLHDTLQKLLGQLTVLELERAPMVRQRLRWARQIEALTRNHPNARMTWPQVRAVVATSPHYAGTGIALEDDDVLGLIPIGVNPKTGYLEFYHLRSAWNGDEDPASIPIPEHTADGSVEVDDDTGIVFVLLPGGSFRMGATLDESDPNFDAFANEEDRAVDVVLAPFFLARHEMTQGQWRRLWTGDPSLREPSVFAAGANDPLDRPLSGSHPVENVDWVTADRLLGQHMLLMPTGAQWEYGCRAGSSGPYCCDATDLHLHANLGDLSLSRVAAGPHETWSDGYAAHAPAGSFHANAFGLHDVHGNVAEWCRDPLSPYDVPLGEGDGRLMPGGFLEDATSTRGGAFEGPAREARCSERDGQSLQTKASSIGLRAARAIQPLR